MDWLLLNVMPGASERRKHHLVDVETARFIHSVLPSGASAVDVGAHTGVILAEILACSPAGSHHAVEPLPDLAAKLRTRFPTVTVHECILGSPQFVAASGGRSTIHRNIDDPGYSSVARIDHPRVKGKTLMEVSVSTSTLDQLVSSAPEITLIKIDVEGFELEVLQGAIGVLSNQRPAIVIEHERIDHESASTRRLHELLSQHQYRVTLLIHWRAPVWLDLAAFEASVGSGDSYFVALPDPR